MKDAMNLIVMLTWHDKTVPNALQVFQDSLSSKADCWGFKEEPLPLEDMQALFALMRQHGKTTALEVVAYTEEACLAGAQKAAACGCDYLIGTCFFDSVNQFCQAHHMKYMPYVGQVSGRPSILEGTVEEMVREAREYIAKGAWGVDLLAYRYAGDADALLREVVPQIPAPVCIAGSVDCIQKLDTLQQVSPWAFTIGGAFFEHRFGSDFGVQIDTVCRHVAGEV